MLKALEFEFEEDLFADENGLYEESLEPEVPEDFYEKFPQMAIFLTRHYTKLFFEGLPLYCGGPVPTAYLTSPELVQLILNTPQIDAVDRAYVIMRSLPEFVIRDHITNHVSIILDMIQRCVALQIPPCYRGGIILAALKYLLGFPVDVR